jgi:predicted dehydrogenase
MIRPDMPRLNVAIAGLGFMGATHARAWMSIPEAQLAAVISNDERKLSGDLTSVGGNLGLEAGILDFSSVRKCRALADVLNDTEIDAIDICLPTDQHSRAALDALASGKHVLVEKPLGLNPAECRRLLDEARARGRVLMAGQVLRFLPAYSLLREIVCQGSPVRSAFFRRRASAPDWNPWLSDPARSGGGVFDLLIHDVDYCISLWGVPTSVRATGYEDLPRGIDVIHGELRYPNVGPVQITGGWHHPKSYPFFMQFTVVTDAATMDWNMGEPDLRVYRADGEPEPRKLEAYDPFARELAYFARCALAGAHPDFCPPEQSAAAVELMMKLLESRARGGETLICR